MLPQYTPPWIARVDRSAGPDACWPWTGAHTPDGYGKIRRGKQTIYAHRAVYEAAYGPTAEGLYVLHRCDNPCCCNPAHLFLGTAADNAQDRDNKRRRRRDAVPKGENHPQARLRIADVEDIRRCVQEGESQGSIARRRGINQSHISRICSGQRWGSVRHG